MSCHRLSKAIYERSRSKIIYANIYLFDSSRVTTPQVLLQSDQIFQFTTFKSIVLMTVIISHALCIVDIRNDILELS